MPSHRMRCSVSEPLGTVMMTWETHELPDFMPSPFTPPITRNIPHLQVYISIFILPYWTLPHPLPLCLSEYLGHLLCTVNDLSNCLSCVWRQKETTLSTSVPTDNPLDRHQMLLFALCPINFGWTNNSVGDSSEFLSSRTLSFTADVFKTVFQVRSITKQIVLSFPCSVPLGFYF